MNNHPIVLIMGALNRSEWVTVDAPHLRVIEAATAEAVDARLDHRRHAYLRSTNGRLLGRPVEGKHLLAGFIECECGARFEAVRGYYTCSARRRMGPTVCPSDVALAVDEIEGGFLDAIAGTVLHPDFIDHVVEALFAARPDDEREALANERQRLATEIANLTAAICTGGDVPALADALRDREARRRVDRSFGNDPFEKSLKKPYLGLHRVT